MKTTKEIYILGIKYTICFKSPNEDVLLSTLSGYTDWTTKEIVILDIENSKKDEYSLGDAKKFTNETLRHEIIHAFFIESGIKDNFINQEKGVSETIVDWFAIQSPKIYKIFKELEILC